jgi:hypothetical protein
VKTTLDFNQSKMISRKWFPIKNGLVVVLFEGLVLFCDGLPLSFSGTMFLTFDLYGSNGNTRVHPKYSGRHLQAFVVARSTGRC